MNELDLWLNKNLGQEKESTRMNESNAHSSTSRFPIPKPKCMTNSPLSPKFNRY